MSSQHGLLAALVLGAATLLSGCAAPDGIQGAGADTDPPAATLDVTSFLGHDCTDALAFAALDTAAAQSLLPDGFVAADYSAFPLGADAAVTIPTGTTGNTFAFIDGVSCPAWSHGGGAAGFAQSAIQIETPRLDPPITSAHYEFYVIEHHFTDPVIIEWLASHGVAVAHPGAVLSEYAGSGEGTFAIEDRLGLVYGFEHLSLAPTTLDGVARLWYRSDQGVGFYAITFDDLPGSAGPVTSCTTRAGTFAHTLVGPDCLNGEATAAVFPAADHGARFTWFQGVFPE